MDVAKRAVLVVAVLLAPALLVGPSPAQGQRACAALEALICNSWASRIPFGPANELHVAVDPTDPLHLIMVAKDYSLGPGSDCATAGAFIVSSAAYTTFDGGATWITSRVPAPYPVQGDPASPLPFRCGSDPVVAFGPDGTAYYILLNFQYTGGRRGAIAVARSANGGVTWPVSDIRVLHQAPGDDKEWGTVDGAGRVHVVWADLSAGDIKYSRSSPAFDFEPARTLAFAGSGNPAPVVVSGEAANDVYVFWRDGALIKFVRSADGGATFTPIATGFSTNPYSTNAEPRFPFMPQVAIDRNPVSPFAGRIYVVWPDASGGDADAYVASSSNQGVTWTPPLRIDDNTRGGRRQIMPTVSVAPNGRIDVAWMDERNAVSTSLPDSTYEAYATSSWNGGTKWSANVLVSEVPLVAAWSRHQNGGVFIGDYMGIVSTNSQALVAFPGNGLDRLSQGLPLSSFARADAYLGSVSGMRNPP